MVIITTTDKSVKIQMPEFVWDVVKTKVKGQIPFSRGTQLLTEIGNLNIFFDQVEADGQTFDSAAELQEWVRVNCFKAGGGAPGEGVQSVTGTLVSGTALNPVINMPSAGDVGAATSEQGELAESAVQPDALADMVESKQESGQGEVVKNILIFENGDVPPLEDRVEGTLYIEKSAP